MTKTKILGLEDKLEATLSTTSANAGFSWPKSAAQKLHQSAKHTNHKRINTTKRGFDLIVAAVGIVLAAPIILCITILVLLKDGRPVFYVSERMKTPSTSFDLIKFRTMYNVPDNQNSGVTGGDKANRITAIGRLLHRYRLDELPQGSGSL